MLRAARSRRESLAGCLWLGDLKTAIVSAFARLTAKFPTMKTRFLPLALALTASALFSTASAMDATPSMDAATQALNRQGSIAVTQAGPFVALGTFRVQVAAKLGRPDLALPDGTWLFRHRRVEGSDAAGTLVVRFNAGRVSSMSLVTPAVATALYEAARKPSPGLVATK